MWQRQRQGGRCGEGRPCWALLPRQQGPLQVSWTSLVVKDTPRAFLLCSEILWHKWLSLPSSLHFQGLKCHFPTWIIKFFTIPRWNELGAKETIRADLGFYLKYKHFNAYLSRKKLEREIQLEIQIMTQFIYQIQMCTNKTMATQRPAGLHLLAKTQGLVSPGLQPNWRSLTSLLMDEHGVHTRIKRINPQKEWNEVLYISPTFSLPKKIKVAFIVL